MKLFNCVFFIASIFSGLSYPHKLAKAKVANQNSITITVDGVDSVFPDEIQLPPPVGSPAPDPGITLKICDDVNDTYIDAEDQVLRVGTLYIKKSTTEIMFATVPASVYSNASITYGKSNATSVTLFASHLATLYGPVPTGSMA